MRVYRRRQSKKRLLTAVQNKWQRGLNLLVSKSEIRPDELAEAIDIELIEDGKIQCPRTGQDYFGNDTSGASVQGIYPYYKSDGTRKLVAMVGTRLKAYNTSTGDFDNISGYTYNTSIGSQAVTAFDRLYITNEYASGVDPLTYYNGTSITTFTAISAPAAPTVTRTGTTGTFVYYYKITAITDAGETTPSSEGHSDLNVSSLDSSNYMSLSWSAVTNATGYNVYVKRAGMAEYFFLINLSGNASVSYIDKGTVTPSTVFTPPEGNTTGGAPGKYIELYKDSLFLLGDPSNPSRMYYSAGGDLIDNFTVSSGGGFIDISKNDGQVGTGMKVFKDSLVVFKEDSIYKFAFSTSGLPSVTQVNPAIGCVAPRGIVAIDNDLVFPSRVGISTLGNTQGFAFDVLRVNEQSAKVRSEYKGIDPMYVKDTSGIYVNDSTKKLCVFSYVPSGASTNSKALVLDTERSGWYIWTNIQARCWCVWRGTDGVNHYLYGDASSGRIKEILTGSDDFGSAIEGSFALKAESFGDIALYKNLKDMSVVLRNPRGSVNLSVVMDGASTEFSSNISTINPSINFGHMLFGAGSGVPLIFGESVGTGSVTSSDEIVLRTAKNVNIGPGKTFQLKFNNGTSGASFILLDTKLLAKARSDRYRLSEDIISA